MKWLFLPCLSLLLFGVGSIFLKRGLSRESADMFFPIYVASLFMVSLAITIPRIRDGGIGRITMPLALYAIALGVCVGSALLCQLKAMEIYPSQATMIILITSLFPIVTIMYDLIVGDYPTPKQWIGIVLCLIGLVFIGYPKNEAAISEKKAVPVSTPP